MIEMKKAWLLAGAVVMFIPVTNCASPATTPAETAPPVSDFEFIFRYGVTARNVIDTYQDKFTKDLINDPPITANLRLTEEEMDRIYRKMVEIGFFNYPDRFTVNVPPGEPVQVVIPFDIYQFTVEKDSQIKRLDWDDKIKNPDEKADRLRDLISLIIEIIESKPEYKQLPEPRGGYL